MSETHFETFCQMAKEMGATHAKVISLQSVVTAAWVRLKCQYGCVRFAHRRLALRWAYGTTRIRKTVDMPALFSNAGGDAQSIG